MPGKLLTHIPQLFLQLLFILAPLFLLAQEEQPKTERKKPSMRDSLDGKLDLSDFIIDAHGFIPVPVIISEPALGGFGGVLAAVFLRKKEPFTDSKGRTLFSPPDITTGVVGYTANKSWFAGGGRMASIPKYRLRYKVGAAYADINMSYYRTLSDDKEREFKFNFQTIPVYLFVAKQFRNPRWIAGLQYLYLHTKVSMQGSEDLPEFVTDKEVKSNISMPGIVSEYDSRDNIFTADRGVKLHGHINWSNSATGSDFDFWRLNPYIYWYHPWKKNWINAFRFDMQQAFGDPPFYMLPYVDMRGIPSNRYQGRTTFITELEQRYDFTMRWSGVLFGGFAKAFDDYDEFGSSKNIVSVGGGFRYLIARKFKVRMGIDVAKGPDDWAYYIVFGTAWLR